MIFLRIWVLQFKPKAPFVVLERFEVNQINVGSSVLYSGCLIVSSKLPPFLSSAIVTLRCTPLRSVLRIRDIFL
jgi:hypothetical protein